MQNFNSFLPKDVKIRVFSFVCLWSIERVVAFVNREVLIFYVIGSLCAFLPSGISISLMVLKMIECS